MNADSLPSARIYGSGTSGTHETSSRSIFASARYSAMSLSNQRSGLVKRRPSGARVRLTLPTRSQPGALTGEASAEE